MNKRIYIKVTSPNLFLWTCKYHQNSKKEKASMQKKCNLSKRNKSACDVDFIMKKESLNIELKVKKGSLR